MTYCCIIIAIHRLSLFIHRDNDFSFLIIRYSSYGRGLLKIVLNHLIILGPPSFLLLNSVIPSSQAVFPFQVFLKEFIFLLPLQHYLLPCASHFLVDVLLLDGGKNTVGGRRCSLNLSVYICTFPDSMIILVMQGRHVHLICLM